MAGASVTWTSGQFEAWLSRDRAGQQARRSTIHSRASVTRAL